MAAPGRSAITSVPSLCRGIERNEIPLEQLA